VLHGERGVRRSSLEMTPFYVMEVMERSAELEREGRSIIHLEVGEPDFPTPQCVVEAAIRAIGEGKTRYTHSLGMIELREAVAESYSKKYDVSVSPETVVVTSGSSPAMLLAFSALLERGDEVIMADPHYACYPNFLHHLDAVPVFVPTRPENGFHLVAEEIVARRSELTKAVIINSPCNPTGTLMSAETIEAVAQTDLTIISDEIYHGLVYEGKERSILEFTDDAVVINGFSKLYAMTGWRLGYLIVPRHMLRVVQILQQNFFISPNPFVQQGGIAALRDAGEDVERMVRRFDERRQLMVAKLREMGLPIPAPPAGAFYVWADATTFGMDSLELAERILVEAGVALAPGIDFGESGRQYLRLSYANSIENIEEGMRRLAGFFAGMKA
jgi:aspartate/methionine/tyrosine aminotransferase